MRATDGNLRISEIKAKMAMERPVGSTGQTYSPLRVCIGWLIHLYTGSGIVVNLYSLLYAFMLGTDFDLFARLNWLAIFIDATDGTLARAVDIKRVIPGYDGALLDNIIDYTTFVLLPALAVIRFDLVPGFVLQFCMASSMLISSAYAFCQTMAKTDQAFVGFPSYWNIVVFYCYYLHASSTVVVFIIVTCAILSFIPIHFIYPTRTVAYHAISLGGAYIWASLMLFASVFPRHPSVPMILKLSLIYVAYYALMSLHLDRLRRKREAVVANGRAHAN